MGTGGRVEARPADEVGMVALDLFDRREDHLSVGLLDPAVDRSVADQQIDKIRKIKELEG